MARIRSIKPEFWSSEQLAECSPSARLMFVGLWTFADDGGVIPDRPIQIKMQIFPGDQFTKQEISAWVDELVSVGLLGRYVNNNECFLWVTGWEKHQRIDKPTFKYPGPLAEGSTTIRQPFDNHSNSPLYGEERSGGDRSGEEGIGEDSGVVDKSPTPPETEISKFTVPLIDKSEYRVTQTLIDDLQRSFPGINAETELLKCRAWNVANEKNRKTRAGVLKHITAWLSRAQDKAPVSREPPDDPRESARRMLFGEQEDPIEGEARRIQ